jgi:hypothetical protein
MLLLFYTPIACNRPLVQHVWLDKLLYVLFQRCSLVEETSALLVLHGDLWFTTAIDDLDNIPIGLCTVCHEAFEVGILDAILCHEIVEFSPHDTLDLRVLQLHVTYGDGHDLAICNLVYVKCHCSPFLDPLDMVKYEPSVLEISSWLHALDEVDTTSSSVYQHLEDVHLILALTWKDVAVDVLNYGVPLHSHDAIMGPLLPPLLDSDIVFRSLSAQTCPGHPRVPSLEASSWVQNRCE